MSEGPVSTRSRISEGVTIVVGILLALMVDASWDYVQDRSRERELLEGLHTEFVRNGIELDSDQQRRIEIQELISLALRADPTGEEAFSGRSRDVVSLLRSEDVRRALLVYLRERDRLAVAEERERTFVAEQVEPYLRGRLPMELAPTDADGFGPIVDPAEVERVFTEDELRSIAYLRWERADTSRRFAAGLGRAIEAVLEAVGEG